ncbi:MAG TPA: phage baseplate assembly protein V [Pyrinomonadaceae bacterium]|nr:phage baseplate assembly protein V [Pyrinomonadaceae bacterium]
MTQAVRDLVIPSCSFGASYLAEVVAVNDPDNLSRVQVRLLSFDGVGEQDAPLWARVAVPFAGDNRGAFMLPDVGDEVLVNFVNGDPRLPVVVGGLWNGNARAPETLGGSGDRVDRWTIVGKAGTRIAIVEENAGESEISLTTPNGVSLVMTDSGGGKIEFEVAGNTITFDSQGVSIQSPSKIKTQSTQVEVTSGQVKVDSALADFTGMVKSNVLQSTTVIGSTYTPGAGNVW